MNNEEVAAFLEAEIPRLERGLARYEKDSDHPNPEYRHGAQSFARKYRRDLMIARLARAAIAHCLEPVP